MDTINDDNGNGESHLPLFTPDDILAFKSQLKRYYSIMETINESGLGKRLNINHRPRESGGVTDNNNNVNNNNNSNSNNSNNNSNEASGIEMKEEEEASDLVPSNPIAPTLSWQCANSLLFMGPNKVEHGQIGITHSDIGCFSKSTFIPLVLSFPYARTVSEKLSRSYPTNEDELLGLQRAERANFVRNSGLRVNVEVPVVTITKAFIRHKRQQYRDKRNIERDDKRRKLEIDQDRKRKLVDFNRSLMNHREEFLRFHKNKKMEIARTAKAIKTHVDLVEFKKEKDGTQAEARRIKALKENDMEAYLKLVQETKNDRLHFLINQTDTFILKIQQMMEGQRSDSSNTNSFGDVPKEDNEKNTTADDGKGGTKVMKEYYQTAHSKFEKVCQPSIMKGGDLKEYQLSGLQWLVSLYNNNLNGILADEMGLGKTIQTIALLAYIMEVKKVNGPFLIVVPLSTLSNWVNETSKWCPSMIKVVYKGTPNERKKIFKEEVEAQQFNLLLTTYEYIMKDKSTLKKIEWVYIIVDEGHRMKNANSKFAQTLGLVYRSRNRILLTGTPLQNNLPELWALLNFLLPSVFSSLDSFDEWFNKPFASFRNNNNVNTTEDASLNQEERLLIVHRLHEVLRPFMLRRVKDQVLDQLPEKIEKVIKCDLSGWQKTLYRAIQQKSSDLQSGESGISFNNAIMQLRKVCNHPYLFLTEWNIDDYIIRSSGKFDLLNRMLPKLKRAGHRVLMFSQMTQLMTILERFFDMKGYKYLRLDGSTNSEERERTMFMFNDPNSPHFIFLLSTRAGGLGLNLASADTVILFDSDWNPMMDAQAQDRAHRIGQKNEVRVFRFITNSPVEERILARATDKKNLNSLVVEAGQFNRGQDKKADDDNANKEMMEVLLNEYAAGGINIPTSVGMEEEEDDEKEYDEKDNENNDDINMMMAINESELALYQEMDREKKIQDAPLLGTDELPTWLSVNHWHTKHNTLVNILNNTKSNAAMANTMEDPAGRKRTDAVYDDNMTEKQFLRAMDKKIMEEEVKKVKPVKREEKTTEAAVSTVFDDVSEQLLSIINELHKIERDDGSLLIELFREKPNKKYFPDYYSLISKPLSFKEITQRITKKIYKSIDELEEDLAIICNNARVYNTDKSSVYIDSELLRTEFYEKAYDAGLLGSNIKPELPIVGSKITTVATSHGSFSPQKEPTPKKLILRLNLKQH